MPDDTMKHPVMISGQTARLLMHLGRLESRLWFCKVFEGVALLIAGVGMFHGFDAFTRAAFFSALPVTLIVLTVGGVIGKYAMSREKRFTNEINQICSMLGIERPGLWPTGPMSINSTTDDPPAWRVPHQS